MDGASKFVKGDAIAAIIITVVNLVGGFTIGIVQHKMSFGDAVSTYSLLTIGDGLVSQIPALLLSVATGIIVTRAAGDADMGTDLIGQLSRQQQPLRIAGLAALGLCLIPGIPKLPFLVAGGLLVLLSTRVSSEQENAEAALALDAAEEAAAGPAPDSMEALLDEIRVDPLELELSGDIIDLVDTASGGDLLDRVKALRRKVATDLGVVVPPVRTRDNLDLPMGTYAIRLFGVEVARGQAPPGTVLAIGDGLEGCPAVAPRSRSSASRPSGSRPSCAARPSSPVRPWWTARRCSPRTSPRSSAATPPACSVVRTSRCSPTSSGALHPAVVDELTPTLLSLGEIHRVLQVLLEEQVSVRDLARIFEALSLRARVAKDIDGLVDAARETLGPAVVAPYVTEGTISVISFDPMLEQRLLEGLRVSDAGGFLALDADLTQALLTQLAQLGAAAEDQNLSPVLVCAPQIRAAVRRMVAPSINRLPVLSYGELTGPIQIRSVGVVNGQAPAAAAVAL